MGSLTTDKTKKTLNLRYACHHDDACVDEKIKSEKEIIAVLNRTLYILECSEKVSKLYLKKLPYSQN